MQRPAVYRVFTWKFKSWSSLPHNLEEAAELMLMFSGKPDSLTIEVLLKDESGAYAPAFFHPAECCVPFAAWSRGSRTDLRISVIKMLSMQEHKGTKYMRPSIRCS